MARLPRLYAPDVTQLVQVRFAHPLAAADEPTPATTLNLLHAWLIAEIRNTTFALHGWALLPDRLIMLGTPSSAKDVSRVVQSLGRRMAARMTHGRAFDGRYRSALVDNEWVIPSLVWLESRPVIQGLVDVADRWPWSSAQMHVGQRPGDHLLADHAHYWALGNTPFARQARYQDALRAGLGAAHCAEIERALFGQWALGGDEFTVWLASRCTRRARPAPRGRPRKSDDQLSVTN